MKRKKPIEYKPIRCPNDNGLICLTVHPPGVWMDGDTDYLVMIGGCGVARTDSMKEAEAALASEAKERLERYISEAEAEAAHYRNELKKFKLKRIQ